MNVNCLSVRPNDEYTRIPAYAGMSPAIPQFVERNESWRGVSRVLGFPGTSHSWAVPRPHHAHLSVVSGTNGPGKGELELRCREHRHHRHRQRITIIHINVNVYDRRRGLAGYPFGTVLTLRAYAFSGLRVRSYAKCALL